MQDSRDGSAGGEESLDLARRAAAGDELAVEELLLRHLPALRAFVRLRMGPELRAKESASDLTQSTCREVLQHIDRFQHGGEASFRQWLFTTALRKVKNRVAYYRAGKRDVGREAAPAGASGEADLDLLYQTLSTPSRRLMGEERRARLEAAFDQLPEEYREVILLARIVGLPHAEVARSMGRSVSASRSLLYRALAELAARM